MMADEKSDDEQISEDLGFTAEELDSLMDGLSIDMDDMDVGTYQDEDVAAVKQDNLPDIREEGLLASRGDTWVLGNHKLVCGDCTGVDYLVKLLDGIEPSVMWSSPPADDIEDVEIGTTGIRIGAEYLAKGASVFIKYDATSIDEIAEMWIQPLRLSSEIIWLSDAPVEEGRYFRRSHESIWYGWKFGGSRKWMAGGSVPSYYEYPRPNASEQFKGIMPVGFIGSVLKNVVEPGDIVYNPFAGFGSALLACEQLGARCFCMENSPKKCDFIIRRWQQHTGDKAYQEE